MSTAEEYIEQMDSLFSMLLEKCDHVVVVGNWFVDEAKTNPKQNPLTGGTSYFTNERRVGFSNKAKQICMQKGISYIDVAVPEEEWIEKYLHIDGLHPNQAGHQVIFRAIQQEIDLFL